MRSYKLVLLLKADVKKEDKEKLFESVKKWAGKVEKDVVTDMGSRKLAYKIKGAPNGEYSLIEFQTDSLSSDLEKRIQMQENVLRHLLVRVD